MRFPTTPLLVFVLLGGCSLFESDGSGRDPDIEIDGGLSPALACDEPTAMQWRLACPMPNVVEPLALLELQVEGLDEADTELYLWLGEDDEDENVFQPSSIAPVDPTMDDGRYQVTALLPALDEGIYRIALGSGDERRSNAVEVRVEVPEPRLTQAEAAEVMRVGLTRMVRDTRALFELDDPAWQAYVAESYDTGQLDNLGAWLDDTEQLADLVHEDYMAVPAEDERVLQAALESSGWLSAMEAMEAPAAGWPDRTPIALDTIQSPIHRMLIALDSVSFGIHLAGTALDVITLITAVIPGAQPIAAVGVGTKVIIAAIKYVIDTFVPTDLVDIEMHGQATMFDGEAAAWTFWGTFQPQNSAGGAIRSLDDLVIEAIGEIFPLRLRVGRFGRLRMVITDLIRSMFVRLGFSSALAIPHADFSFLGIKTIIDQEAYATPLLELLSWIPGLIGLKVVAILAEKFDLASALEVDSATPAWADPNVIDSFGRVSLGGVTWPTTDPGEQAFVRLNATAYRLVSKELFLVTIPGWERLEVLSDRIVLRQAPDPTNPNELISDERYVFRNVPRADGSPEWPWIGTRTPTERPMVLRMGDMGGFSGGAQVDVLVNDVAQVTGATPPRVFASGMGTIYDLSLQPGLNRIRFVNRVAMLTSCSVGTAGGEGCLLVEFPGAVNADTSKAIIFGSTADGSHTLEVWMPPVYE